MSRRWRLLLAAGAIAGAASALFAVACDINNHLLVGEPYQPGSTCLGVPAAIDDLAGPDPGQSCAPQCIATNAGGATAYFVTTTCPPYSPQYRAETADAARDAADPCTLALVVFADGSICTPGSLEAGAEAAVDAAVDAGPDADAGAADADAGPDAAGDGGSDGDAQPADGGAG